MGYGKRSNICVTGAPEGKESKQKQYIGDTGRDFSKTNKRHQVRNSRSTAHLKKDK